MRRAWRGAMPVALTLPLGLERRPRVRERRLRRLAIAALILGTALLAAGFWLPAKAGDGGQRQPLAVGDELTLHGPDGTAHTYEISALDIVDAARTELPLGGDDGSVLLVTRWPVDAVPVGGRWRHIVTARPVPAAAPLARASTRTF